MKKTSVFIMYADGAALFKMTAQEVEKMTKLLDAGTDTTEAALRALGAVTPREKRRALRRALRDAMQENTVISEQHDDFAE